MRPSRTLRPALQSLEGRDSTSNIPLGLSPPTPPPFHLDPPAAPATLQITAGYSRQSGNLTVSGMYLYPVGYPPAIEVYVTLGNQTQLASVSAAEPGVQVFRVVLHTDALPGTYPGAIIVTALTNTTTGAAVQASTTLTIPRA